MDLSPGWHTDLAVLRLGGSQITEHDDHLVIRSPHNPGYHWGNFILQTDPGESSDADRWTRLFHNTFPRVRHLAIGLVGAPEPGAWAGPGVEVTADTVLTTRRLPRLAPAPRGYVVRALSTEADWAALLAAELADNARTGREPPADFEAFSREQLATRRQLVHAGDGAWFGAFTTGDDGGGSGGDSHDDRPDALAASLGIVLCDKTARYQSVSTHPDHRRRGLATHLLGVAARWAADQGSDEWVIVTESDNPAGRVYRSVGFAPDRPIHQVYAPRTR